MTFEFQVSVYPEKDSEFKKIIENKKFNAELRSISPEDNCYLHYMFKGTNADYQFLWNSMFEGQDKPIWGSIQAFDDLELDNLEGF